MWEHFPQDILTLNIIGGRDAMYISTDGDVNLSALRAALQELEKITEVLHRLDCWIG